MAHRYTQEQKDFIKKNVKGNLSDDLTKMFNEHFSLSLKTSQIRAYMKNHGVKNGLNTSLRKGNKPWNKDMKGVITGGIETQFKKGYKPHNYMQVGTERVNGNGYVDIKIEDPNKWRGKHILIWEKHNGPVPEGHVIIFGDGDKRNFDINNLLLVSRKQLARLNQNRLIKNDAELTKTGIIIADMYSKISERKANNK